MPFLVGTSSWADPEFVRTWYPPKLPAAERLGWYAGHFDWVEVNSSYYAIPDQKNAANWVASTPENFSFDFKVFRLLSRHATEVGALPKEFRPRGKGLHDRARLDPELERDLVAFTKEQLSPVIESGKFGGFLVQLSPYFSPDRHKLPELENLLDALSPLPVALEFRHAGWLADDLRQHSLDWLSDFHASLVSVDAPVSDDPRAMPAVDFVTTSSQAYLRLHGRNAAGFLEGKSVPERFNYDYGEEELTGIADRARRLGEQAGVVKVAVNVNKDNFAPKAATRLRTLLERK